MGAPKSAAPCAPPPARLRAGSAPRGGAATNSSFSCSGPLLLVLLHIPTQMRCVIACCDVGCSSGRRALAAQRSKSRVMEFGIQRFFLVMSICMRIIIIYSCIACVVVLAAVALSHSSLEIPNLSDECHKFFFFNCANAKLFLLSRADNVERAKVACDTQST